MTNPRASTRAYLARVEQALIDAVYEAHDRRALALAAVGSGIEPTVAFNRRFVMRDGRTVTHPGLGNPDIVEPAGPVDPEVGVLGAWDAGDPRRLLGCVVNFACHATTSPGGISANYIHYLEKADPGLLRQGLRRGVPGRCLRRHHPGRQPEPLPLSRRRPLGAARRRQGRRRGAEDPADDGARPAGSRRVAEPGPVDPPACPFTGPGQGQPRAGPAGRQAGTDPTTLTFAKEIRAPRIPDR